MTDWSAVVLFVVVAVPVALLAFYLRKPYDGGSVPRDSLAMKGKSQVPRALGILPNEAFDDQIRDRAADQPEKPDRHESDHGSAR